MEVYNSQTTNPWKLHSTFFFIFVLHLPYQGLGREQVPGMSLQPKC